MLGVLRHLNYKAWFALAEFVDNSVQSYSKHKKELFGLHGSQFRLQVKINIDESLSRITIRDNAAGIQQSEYSRAFRPAAVPSDRTGLGEFGMGMKSAACWFTDNWTVRTSALNESTERVVKFDINKIVEDSIDELEILENRQDVNMHFTEIILKDVHHLPVRRTLGKIKDHLTDIYREFIRNDELTLMVNEEQLKYESPRILNAPYYKEKDGVNRLWRKEIKMDFGDGLSVSGFAALREKGSTHRAGFSLFRRRRVIQGSGDECYRPEFVFGRSNSYRYQRLFGELHLDGFEVSHTKDGFRWDENEQPFLELLREELDKEDLPLLTQAENYRARVTKDSHEYQERKEAAKVAMDNTVSVLKEHLPTLLPNLIESSQTKEKIIDPLPTSSVEKRSFIIRFNDQTWKININLDDDPAVNDWLAAPIYKDEENTININVSIVHPFMEQFVTGKEELEVALRVASAIALAEVITRKSGVKFAGRVRGNINEILKDALSNPN